MSAKKSASPVTKSATVKGKSKPATARALKAAKVSAGVGSRHPMAKLTPREVREIRKALAKKNVIKAEIARHYAVSVAVITRLQRGLSYKDVV